MKKVIIIGAGGHAKVCADIILESGDEIFGFYDEFHPQGEFLGYRKLGSLKDWKQYCEYEFIIAIGDTTERVRIAQMLVGAKWYTAIHPTAVVSNIDVQIGEGTVVMANAVINAGTYVGKHCIINTGCVVEHDNFLGDYVHISVGAHLGGKVNVDDQTWIGLGVSVLNDVRINANIVVGAGAVVIHDLLEQGTYVGVPARMMDKVEKG